MAYGVNGGSWQPQISPVTQALLNQGLVLMIWLAYLYVCTWQVIFSHDVLFKIDIFRQCHSAGVNCEYASLCFFIRKWEFNLSVNAPYRVVKSKSKLQSNTSVTNSFITNTSVCNTPFIENSLYDSCTWMFQFIALLSLGCILILFLGPWGKPKIFCLKKKGKGKLTGTTRRALLENGCWGSMHILK